MGNDYSCSMEKFLSSWKIHNMMSSQDDDLNIVDVIVADQHADSYRSTYDSRDDQMITVYSCRFENEKL